MRGIGKKKPGCIRAMNTVRYAWYQRQCGSYATAMLYLLNIWSIMVVDGSYSVNDYANTVGLDNVMYTITDRIMFRMPAVGFTWIQQYVLSVIFSIVN